jgi:Family of unknown function (DUF5990)
MMDCRMRLTVRGRDLPGSTFGERSNIHVGLQIRRDASGLVPGHARAATWVTDVTVIEGPDGVDYRGEAVQGRRGERFLYLTWGTVEDEAFTMFRRAKVMLNDLPAALRSEPAVVVHVPLTQGDGSPRCARVPANILTWSTEQQARSRSSGGGLSDAGPPG